MFTFDDAAILEERHTDDVGPTGPASRDPVTEANVPPIGEPFTQ